MIAAGRVAGSRASADYRSFTHGVIGSVRAGQVVNVLLTLGDRAHIIAEAARRVTRKAGTIIEFDELDPLVTWLKTNLTKTDVVLIKGSHGLRMNRIISSLEVRS